MAEVVPVIAVDGPSASGKGTLALRLAARLGWHLLDSGALYRIVGLMAHERGIDFDDGEALAALTRGLDIDFRSGDAARVFVDGRDVTDPIRREKATESASLVGRVAAVRQALLAVQLGFRRLPGLVADGRDMGTVVFTDARLKIFLTASAEVRAKRRYNQLKDKGLGVSLRGLLEGIQERDERDRTREVSPLEPAPDAVVLDSTHMNIDEVTAQAIALVEQRGFLLTDGT